MHKKLHKKSTHFVPRENILYTHDLTSQIISIQMRPLETFNQKCMKPTFTFFFLKRDMMVVIDSTNLSCKTISVQN